MNPPIYHDTKTGKTFVYQGRQWIEVKPVIDGFTLAQLARYGITY